MGQETTTAPIIVGSFRGLNTKLSNISLTDREATSLKNINLTKETIEVRAGSSILTTTQLIEAGVAKAVTGIFQAILGSTTYQVITGGSKIYSMSEAGVLTDITGAVTITDSPNNLFSFALAKDSSGNDIIVAANGVNPPIKWTGTGNVTALGGSPPANFKHLLWRKNRLFATEGEYVYHSDLFNAESWNSLFWVARFSAKGTFTNEVTGISEFGDGVAIFKEKAITLFSGESFVDGYIQQVVSGEGSRSGYSVCEIPSRRYGNILAFVNSNNELKGFNGTKDILNLSDPIDANTLRGYVQSRAAYATAIHYKEKDQYFVSLTNSGGEHNRIVAYDYALDAIGGEDGTFESTMLVHYGITANALSIVNLSGVEYLLTGTYDGWILKQDVSNNDVVQASQIAASAGGAVRSSNVVTITTSAPHEFVVGDEVIVTVTTIATGSGSFDGTFTVASTPSSTTFTYAQTAADATGGAGIVRLDAEIEAHWQSKKYAFKNAAHQKQLNDMNIVTASSSTGVIRTTVNSEKLTGTADATITPSVATYGDDAIYGVSTYGGSGTSYTRVELTTNGENAIVGRYLQFKFENVDGFRFGIEEFIAGATDLGYQAEYIP